MRRALTPAAAALVAGVALVTSACGEKSEPEPAPPSTTSETPSGTGATTAPDEGGGGGGGDVSKAERAAARRRADLTAIRRTLRGYIAGLDRRNAQRVCSLVRRQVVDRLPLPRERGSCAASLEASIGYKDPRGLPQFAGVEIAAIRAIQLGRDSARATTEIVTDFADRQEPSIEDDIVYLARTPDGWRVAKPSTALYRAIGAEPGPEAIAPPG